ncbi:hypothetical protein CLOP_g15212, partial [Closterium sp. NIES-67]
LAGFYSCTAACRSVFSLPFSLLSCVTLTLLLSLFSLHISLVSLLLSLLFSLHISLISLLLSLLFSLLSSSSSPSPLSAGVGDAGSEAEAALQYLSITP